MSRLFAALIIVAGVFIVASGVFVRVDCAVFHNDRACEVLRAHVWPERWY